MSELQINTNIMLALFRATLEQGTFCIGKFSKKSKQDFNTWFKMGNKMLNEIEKTNDGEYLDAMTDYYHNLTTELKKQHEEFNK